MDVDERIKHNTELVMRNPTILKTNKVELQKYIQTLRANQLSQSSIDLELYAMKYFLEVLGKVDVRKVTNEDIVRVVNKINVLKRSKKSTVKNTQGITILSLSTREKIKTSIKKFYKYLLGKGTYFPEVVAWVKPKMPRKTLVKEELLSEEDVTKLLEHAKCLRDRAIISLLFEGGMRIGELLRIRLRDVHLYEVPAKVVLYASKTDTWRTIAIVTSVPDLKSYLDTRRELQPDDIIWRGERYTRNGAEYHPITHDTVRCAIARAAKEASIFKKCNPHAFRHASATINAKWMKEMELKKFYGWSPFSTETGTYVSLADSDVYDAVLRKNGLPVTPKSIESQFTVWICTTCSNGEDKIKNAVEARFCSRCKSPRDVKTVVKYDEEMRELREQVRLLKDINKLNNNPEDVAKLIEGKSIEQIQKERAAKEFFLTHQNEIMQEYVDSMVYSEENYGERPPLDKEGLAKWSKRQQEISRRRQYEKTK